MPAACRLRSRSSCARHCADVYVFPQAAFYTNPRGLNGWQANEAWHRAASPAAVLALIALARRAQPYATGGIVPDGLHLAGEGLRPWRAQPEREAPQAVAYLDLDKLSAGGMAYVTSFRTNDKQTALFKSAASLFPPCGAQPAESGKETAQLSIGFANNDQGVHVSVMQQHAGGAVTLLHQAKVPAGDSFTRFAVSAQQAAAPTWGQSIRLATWCAT